MKTKYNAIIIGSGIIGCSIAFELSKNGLAKFINRGVLVFKSRVNHNLKKVRMIMDELRIGYQNWDFTKIKKEFPTVISEGIGGRKLATTFSLVAKTRNAIPKNGLKIR